MRQSVVTSETSGNVAGKGLDQSQVAGSILHERDQEKSGSSLKWLKFIQHLFSFLYEFKHYVKS